MIFFFFKQKTAYEMRISDWSSDVCSSDLLPRRDARPLGALSGRPPPRAFKRLRRSTVKRDAGMIENDDEAFADNYAERDQAKALREQARAGGLRFEAYLPGDMADWLLAQVERGHFVDPSEAVFAIVQNFIEMEPHRDLRDELLRRILDESVARGLEDVKAGRVRPADEVFDELRRELAKPRPEPARWQKRSEEHTSELQSLMRNSYAVFCLKNKKNHI